MKKIIIALITLLTLHTNLSAQKMEMTDTDGKSYTVIGTDTQLKIEGMEGKVVFLEFFGLKCPACKLLMPNLINLQKKYPNKLKVMAIELQQHDNTPINAYKKKHGINYTTISNYDVGRVVRFIADKSGWVGEIPFLVAIDATGQVQFTQTGVIPEETLEQKIKEFSK